MKLGSGGCPWPSLTGGWERARQRAATTLAPAVRHGPAQVRPQGASPLTQVDVPEGAAPDLPAQPVPVPNPQLHGGSSARPRPGSVALPALPARALPPHSPAVPEAIAALVSALDPSETGSTAAAAPGKDGRGFPTRPAPQPPRLRAAILSDLTSLATGAGRAGCGGGRAVSRGSLWRAGAVPPHVSPACPAFALRRRCRPRGPVGRSRSRRRRLLPHRIASHRSALPSPRAGPARAVPAVRTAPRELCRAGNAPRSPGGAGVVVVPRRGSLQCRGTAAALGSQGCSFGRGASQSLSHDPVDFRGKTCHSCWGGVLGSPLRPAVGWRNHLPLLQRKRSGEKICFCSHVFSCSCSNTP